MELDPQMLEQIEKVILPFIRQSAETALKAYEATRRPDGTSYSDNWVLGCTCWRILFNALNQELDAYPSFKKEVCNNVMKITIQNNDEPFSFYIYRVNEDTRIPKGAKSLKRYLQERLWLSDEIRDTVLKRSNGVNVLGYDISIESGLGHISLDRLVANGKNKFEPVNLYNFSTPASPDTQTVASGSSIEPEEISKPAVTREEQEKDLESKTK